MLITRCKIAFSTLDKNIFMAIFNKRTSGTSVKQELKQSIYINKLIIMGNPGNYDVKLVPTIFQKIKQAIGVYPSTEKIERAVRLEMLGEK